MFQGFVLLNAVSPHQHYIFLILIYYPILPSIVQSKAFFTQINQYTILNINKEIALIEILRSIEITGRL